MGKLFALVEAYPDLKASERFADLQRALTDVEDDLQNARRYYNAIVRDLNTRIQSFPDLIVARTFGFREWEFFSLDDRSEAVARISAAAEIRERLEKRRDETGISYVVIQGRDREVLEGFAEHVVAPLAGK